MIVSLQAELFNPAWLLVYFTMNNLRLLIESSEDDLISRILRYAHEHNYVKYTSTLHEAWRMSIFGLTDAMANAISYYERIPELGPDEDFTKDPIAIFAIAEAQRHRERGVTLSMFLGLMKYYRQSYLDLIADGGMPSSEKVRYALFVNRFFDRIEIGFCSEWLEQGEKKKMKELQIANRAITNEKNKFFTIIESLNEPVVLLNSENRIEHINHAASLLMQGPNGIGRPYYDQGPGEVFPWLSDKEVEMFVGSAMAEGSFEKEVPGAMGTRHLVIKMKKMLDVSQKFSGTVIILHDDTEQKAIEKKLRQLATTDSLTGIYNRGWYLSLTSEEIKRWKRNGVPLSIVLVDIDNFKNINDTYGHHIGDAVIKKTCALFQEQLREYDILGRLGGEEFGITMIDCDLKRAADIADRLRTVISSSSMKIGSSVLEFTVSLGVAEYRATDQNVGEVLRRADHAMYEAKNSGRNCVKKSS